jgi:uncharacterized protein (TIGR02147 family)
MQLEQAPINIFSYQSSRQYLVDQVKDLQRRDPTLSIRILAKRMGMKSHALLLMLLQGKRPLRVKHAALLAKGFELSSQERLYLQALIQFDSADEIEEKQLCQLWLADLNPNQPLNIRQIEEYELVSNWLHMAILALSDTVDFNPSPESIAKRFGKRTTVAEVRSAIERLKSMKLIEFDRSGRFKPTHNRVTTADDVANAGARKYHRTVMSLSDQALDSTPLERREFQGFSMAIPDSKIPLAKEMIRKFRSQFAKAMGNELGDQVYQMNIQFFQLTESPARIGRTEDEGVESEWHNQQNQGERNENVQD